MNKKIANYMQTIEDYCIDRIGGSILTTKDVDSNIEYVKCELSDNFTAWVTALGNEIQITWMEFDSKLNTVQYVKKLYKTYVGVINELKRLELQAFPQIIEVEYHQTQLERMVEFGKHVPLVELDDYFQEVDRLENGSIGQIVLKGSKRGKRIVVVIMGHHKGIVFSVWEVDFRGTFKNRVRAYGYEFPRVKAWAEFGLDTIQGIL